MRNRLIGHLSGLISANNSKFCDLAPAVSSRLCFSTMTITPEEAGRRARQLASKHPNSLLLSMPTALAHAGMDHHQGKEEEEHRNSAMAPPLHFASTYTRPADGMYHPSDAIYIRNGSPTRLLLEREIAALEVHGATTGTDEKDRVDASAVITCAFASGMMAVSSILLSHKAPVQVIVPSDCYHGVPTVFVDVFSRFNVHVHRVDVRDPIALQTAVSGVGADSDDVIVWLESPSNPLLQVTDIKATCALVKSIRGSRKTTIVVDSTLAPPTLTQPLQLGVDLVLHSATKYFGGHSDVLLGVVTASPFTERGREIGPILREVQIEVGGVASSMDSWLTLRGLRTLSVRVQKQCDTAMKLAKYLSLHPSVHCVHYPGLKGNGGQYEIACRQMSGGFGGVLSVEMTTEARAMALAGALKTIQRATSLGGTETLIEHRASIEPPGRVTSPPGLLRLAVGLEDANDLIRDLEQALQITDEVVPQAAS
jgi:cystathionine gamma-synthase